MKLILTIFKKAVFLEGVIFFCLQSLVIVAKK